MTGYIKKRNTYIKEMLWMLHDERLTGREYLFIYEYLIKPYRP